MNMMEYVQDQIRRRAPHVTFTIRRPEETAEKAWHLAVSDTNNQVLVEWDPTKDVDSFIVSTGGVATTVHSVQSAITAAAAPFLD